ncbi:MAG: hypothetical protein JXO49_01085 [Deltaproteobacteria bacterium]|nr:hypothetical protein [Candidatus Anaeroferrophillus wilburensis]MBN2887920.1 hypothetical protein [Deltaproteobacteria bacterium]
MRRFVTLLHNQNFILLFALVAGLLAGRGAEYTKTLVLPVLGVVMTLSSLGVSSEVFRSPRQMLQPMVVGVLMNYLVLGGGILLLNHLLISDREIWAGFVLLAAVPPAVAVIPFTVMLGGNLTFTMLATIGGYLSGLLLTPAIAVAFLGTSFIHPGRLLLVMVELILLPLVGSRLLLRTRMAVALQRYRGDLINWCFFLVVYTIVGLNRSIFFQQPFTLLPIASIALLTTFGFGWVIERGARMARLPETTTVSVVLLGTLKNYGTAAGLGLILYGKQAALPATVATIAMILYAIRLGMRKKPMNHD